MTSTNRRADGHVAKGFCTWACLFVLLVLPARLRADDPFKTLALTRPRQPLTAHDFTVPGLTTPSLRLSEFRGKVVLLNFWATWCSPCRAEMPAMERLYQRHKTDGFAVLGISVDRQGAAVVTPFATSFNLTFPIGLDPRMDVAGNYGVVGLPSTFLIGRTGSILAIAVGARAWDSAAAHAMVETLLKE